jgi:hypothetical protein
MGQSPYLCFSSAGFCCWGLGMGRPCPHVKAWGGTAQITTQGHRGTLFSGRFQISGDRGTQLLRAAAPKSKKTQWVAPLDHGKTTLMRRSLITRRGGPRSETTQLTSEVDRFLTGKSPKCLRL